MQIIFSRKGFDSGSGGAASPIVDGRPISLPIPATMNSATTYSKLGMGDFVSAATRGKINGSHYCHHDPMFVQDSHCIFGQCGSAQSHLANQGVGLGDTFIFFGLFREEATGEKHHRIFGFLEIEKVLPVRTISDGVRSELALFNHPHLIGDRGPSDTIYRGHGIAASRAHAKLRLTVEGGPASVWHIPSWLKETGLTYHRAAKRWLPNGNLKSVARGQEFVTNVGQRAAPRQWLEETKALLRS